MTAVKRIKLVLTVLHVLGVSKCWCLAQGLWHAADKALMQIAIIIISVLLAYTSSCSEVICHTDNVMKLVLRTYHKFSDAYAAREQHDGPCTMQQLTYCIAFL